MSEVDKEKSRAKKKGNEEVDATSLLLGSQFLFFFFFFFKFRKKTPLVYLLFLLVLSLIAQADAINFIGLISNRADDQNRVRFGSRVFICPLFFPIEMLSSTISSARVPTSSSSSSSSGRCGAVPSRGPSATLARSRLQRPNVHQIIPRAAADDSESITSTSSSSSSSSSTPPPAPFSPPPADPFADKETYDDGPFARFMIGYFSKKMAAQLGVSDKPRREGYDGFVDLSKEIVRGRTSRQQRQTVADVLASLLPPGGPERFRKLFPFSRWSAEANAMFTMIGFGWLVGPMEVVEVDVTLPGNWRGKEGKPGDVQQWRSGVK